MGLKRYSIRIPKIERRLRRIIIIGSDGYCTFEVLRSLADMRVSVTFLDRRGKLIFSSGPTAPSDARLRRAQSLALGNGKALLISKELISQKLQGQAALVQDMLHNEVAADAIDKLKTDITTAQSIESVRIIEAQAAKVYWQAWSDVPIRWSRKDEKKIPEHWKRFRSRISPMTHSPRLAANPPNAILNLLYALLESESRIAAVAMGLLPDCGMLHVDTPSRDSLACDLMEVCRPKVDAFVLNWLQSEVLRKVDFWQDRNGDCRICTPLVIRLCETADTWFRLVAPVAEYVAAELWDSIPRSLSMRGIATRLTQSTKRAVKGHELPAVAMPKALHLCSGCGQEIPIGNTYCSRCSVPVTRRNFGTGRKMAHGTESLAKRSATQQQHKQAIRKWNPADLPSWLSLEVYRTRILPVLAEVPNVKIRDALQVSEPYSTFIQRGTRIPHKRFWPQLASLVGITGRSQNRQLRKWLI